MYSYQSYHSKKGSVLTGTPISTMWQLGAIYGSVDQTTNCAQTFVSATDSPIPVLLNSATEPSINACNK